MHGDREVGAFAETVINVFDVKADIVQQPDMVCAAELGNSYTPVVDLIGKVFPNYQESCGQSLVIRTRNFSSPL